MKLFSLYLLLTLTYTALGFGPVPNRHIATKNLIATQGPSVKSFERANTYLQRKSRHLTTLQAETEDSEQQAGFFGNISINPPYAIAFVSFLTFAFYRSFTEPDQASMQVLEGFFADPLHPGCNELFATVFNLLGLYFVPIACLLMPGAKGQKLPATPFVLGSMLGGYGFLGPYMITRQPSFENVNKSELGWFTANVLENKIINWGVAALISSAYVTSGCISALFSNPSELFSGYGDLFSQTAIASASTMDLLILTLVAASMIPEDLARRGVKDGLASQAIAASTVLLPVVGAALYCALRPELEE